MKNLVFLDSELETFENMISYYRNIPMEELIKEHPGFIIDDFKKVLMMISTSMDIMEKWNMGGPNRPYFKISWTFLILCTMYCNILIY